MTLRCEPIVTVVLPKPQSQDALHHALRCALGQTLKSIEVLLVDDAADHAQVELVRRLAEDDPRLRAEFLSPGTTPGAALNRALDLAQGRWFTVSDDLGLRHPDRLSRLVHAAESRDVDIVADDLVVFTEDGHPVRRLFKGGRRRREKPLRPGQLVMSAWLHRNAANLGHLQPLISVAAARRRGVRYDEAHTAGAVEDFLRRLLQAGLVARTIPDITCVYRLRQACSQRRAAPVDEDASHLASRDVAFSPAPAEWALEGRPSAAPADAAASPPQTPAGRQWTRPSDASAKRWTDGGARHGASRGGTARPTQPLASASAPAADPPHLWVLSRQRLVGPVNGSSSYLLALVSAFKEAGFRLSLLQPSPAVFGRWPVLRLHPEMAAFDEIKLRTAARLGPYLIALSAGVWLRAARGALAIALQKARLPSEWLGDRPAPYAPAAEWSAEDLLYVSNHGPSRSNPALLLDYAFQVEALPYVRPNHGPTAIVMHDLLHARARTFTVTTSPDSVTTLDEEAERSLLQRADAVFAIQSEEAEWVRRAVVGPDCILAPMAVQAVPTPQVGDDELVGFVGSNTAPNVIGLRWFFETVWPLVLARRPTLHLEVAGSVTRGLAGSSPPNARFLGVVPDLQAFYARQGVVISPLTTGSGLKIKLVEALAAGKAVVATPTTLQGVADRDQAVRIADTPEAFAEAILELAADPVSRARLGAMALGVARARYSAQTCYSEAVRWFELHRLSGAAHAGLAITKDGC